ncbi:hypothetical protein LAZ67_4003508, partial [Cordylochernes scorpioides]
MTYLAKVRKCDLSKLAYELGEVVPPESRIVDLKHLILNSQSYEEEFAKQLLETLIEDRERIEERERIEDRKRIEDRERIERERKEQMVMEFELEKLRIQTTRGNNDTSRSTSNDAHYEIRKLMPKYESKDNDLSFYLILFERQAKRLGLDEDQWAFSLLGLLPYEMTQLIARETEEQSGDYRFVKRLLLKRYKLSPEQFRQKFEKHERSQKGSWRDFAFELRGYFNEWIEGMNVENFDALKDLSVTNQLKKKVPNVLRNHLIDDWTKLNNPDELADKLDEYENVRTEMGPPHWNAKHLIPPSFQQKSARFPNQSEVKETKQGTNVSGQDAARNEISETYPNTLRRMVNRTIRNDKGEPKCFNCNQFGHIARDCPAPRTTLTCRGCGQTGHKERNCTRPKEGLKVANLEVEGLETVPPDVYLKDVKIDNKETVKAMIDTGSSSCLMRESVARRISVDIEPDSTSLYGIGNQTAPAARTVGKTTVDLEIDGIVGREITVFIVNDDAQPYDLLIGRTWTDLPYVSFARIGKNLHIGYSSEFPFANLQEEIKSRRIELRATETVQLESDSINFTSAITDEVKDGYVLFTGVDDACVDSLLELVDGKTTVPIISAGKGKLRVRKNQCVGRVELLNLDDIVVNLDVAEDSFQTKKEEKREGQDQMKRKRPILPEDINVNHSLTSKERQEILDVVNEYRDCFALGMEELGCTDVTKMDIKEVDGSKPVCLRPYKTTASEREAIREIVREWKDNGIVTETRSPYASPVLLVRKKTGDRLVVDYRRLNIQTVKDKFPLPRIDDLLEGLRNAKFFTTLDLAHGYLQIPLTDKAKLKTAFITPDDTGQFERMIFGLANAPAEFQRLMHTVLGPLLNKKAFCYLDDVIIPAKDWREMIERLREVLERIRSAKLTLKPSKCEFGRREVEFLGYVISTGGLKPGPRKIKAIEEFPEPKNVHDIRRFLGLTNFFRRFVKDFARKSLVVKFHDLMGHFATDRTVNKIKELYWFPSMKRYVRRHVAMCLECLFNKVPGGKQQGFLHPIKSGKRPFSIVHMDHVGPFVRSTKGNQELLVIVDNLTRFVRLSPVRNTSTQNVLKVMKSFVNDFGLPDKIISDRGSCFTSRQFEEFCRGNGIHHTLNSTKHPQGNGMVERVNRTVLSTIATSIEDPRRKDWDLKIKEVERDLNNAVNKTTNKTPFETLHGYSPRFHDEILRRLADEDVDPWTEPDRIQESVRTQIENKQEIMKTYYDKKKCRTIQFEVGEIVVMRHVPKMTGEPTKAQPKYRGPLIITEVLPSDTYRVTQLSERTSGRFYTTTAHISQLKSWHSEEDDSATEESPDEEPEVEDTPRRNPRRSCNARFNRGRLKSRNGRIVTELRRSRRLQGREPILQPLPQRIEMEDDHRPTVNGSYLPCQRQRDPSTFSGDGNINPGQWLKEYERVSKYNRWDETMKLANVVFYLNGTAGRWFDNNEESLNSWRSFEDAFRGVFGLQEDSARRAEEVLKSRAQKAEESSESYIQEILSLCHQVNPRMEEGEIVAHIIKGISEDTYQVLVAKDIQTVDEILKFCRHLTTVKQRRIGRTKFARLSNVMPISCVDDSDDLAGLIRRIVREEIQKVFSAPEVINPLREVNALEQTVREEVSRALQPTRPQVNVVQQQPRTPYYNIDRPTQPRKTEHWRTYDDKPICFHCGRPGHVVRYCRERRQVFAEARTRNGGEGRNVGFSSRPPRYDADDDYVTPQTSTYFYRSSSPHPSRARSPARRQSQSPTRRFSRSPKPQNATEAVIDCGRNELHLGETSVLESREEENQRLFASDDFVIPPKSIKKISVINEEVCGVRDVLVSTSKDLLLRKEVLIPNSLVTFRHGRGSIWVANGASWPQLIPSGMNMCTMESYENGNICSLIESSDKLQETQLKSREWSQKINLTLDPGLSEIQRLQLVSCLDEFIDIFDFGSTSIKPTSTVKHKINTGDHSPIKQRPYRVAPSERRLIQDEVNKMIENHIVKPSESPWSSPVILVRKKDGTWRFCVDYRRLNKITKKDVYPLPRIDDALDSLAGSSYFSTMDLRSGYWQIEVDEKDREKTAFITPDGLYEFQVMPFGLCNAPATFERMIDSVLGSLKWNMCLCYLDDIVVYAPTFEEHLRRLQLVLSCIQKAGLSLNHKKCLFGSRRIKILGHLVDANGIHPDPDKVEAVSKFPRPRNIFELRSFLGLCSYYRRFIENFADKARSLHDLLKTEKQFYWDAAQEKAFEVLKTALISEPVLGHFDESADTHLHTDASGHGIGAVLLQIQGGKERPIAYASRSLTKAENNYSTTEKECLAVVWSISKFRPYLFGRPFTVVTDHHSLCWLVGQKDPSGRLARWALKLQEFDVTVIYKSGRKHKDADCLSRSPLENDPPSAVMSLTNVDIEQTKDPDLAKIIDNLNSGYTRKEFSIIDGILYKKNYSTTGRPWLMMIPKHLRSEVMADLHDAPTAGHLGFARTYDKVKKRFYWPGLYRTVRQYVSHCRECQRRKKLPRRPAGQLVSIPPVEKPFYKVGVDLLGRFPVSKDGNRWIIVCTDYMTRYAITKAIPDGGAIETAKFLVENVILKHGAPREMITDRGRNFISQVIKEINALCGIVHRFTTAYHPQTNGLTERFNKTLGDMLSMYTGVEQKDWDQVLPYVTFAYNTAKQEATGYTPFFLVHAREAETYIDAVLPYLPDEISDDYVGELVTRAEEARQLSRSRLLQSQAKDRRLYDQKHTPVYYQKDDLVWVFTPIRKVGLSEKLLKRYFGPYKVTKKLSEVTYEVEPVDPSPRSRKSKDIVHVIRMKPYLDPEEQHSILLGNTGIRDAYGSQHFYATFLVEIPGKSKTALRRSFRLQGLQPQYGFEDLPSSTRMVKSEASGTPEVFGTNAGPQSYACHIPRNPPTFSGESAQDPQRWIKMFERVAKYNKWDETQSLANVVFYLEGTAAQWFDNNEDIIDSWTQFKTNLCEVFGKKEELTRRAEMTLKTRAQKPGETTESYIQEILSLCSRVNPEMEEEEKVGHLMKGIAEDFYQTLIVKDTTTVDELVKFCRQLENMKQRRIKRTRYERLPNVTPISSDCEEDLALKIRRIVQEELQKIMPKMTEVEPFGTSAVNSLEAIVKEEVQQVLAPITRRNIQSQRRRTFVPRFRREDDYTPYAPRTSDQWRTVDNQPTVSIVGSQDMSYVTVEKEDQGKAEMWIANGNSKPLMIPSRMALGTMSDVDVGSICSLKCDELIQEEEMWTTKLDQKIEAMIDSNLTEDQQNKMMNVLKKFSNVFDFSGKSQPARSKIKHKIDTGDHAPTKQRPYRVSGMERKIIQQEVDRMMKQDIIQFSESPWSSPVVLVKKKNGSWRFCVDYRRLNKITKKDVYPLPRVDDALDNLSGARYYSSMDLRTGYWQIEVDEHDREKTAFITPDGLYEFRVMPFGLCNAPATFERMMDTVLKGLKWNICLCYLDDIVVYGPSFEEHIKRLEVVLECLQQAGLNVNNEKCLSGSRQLKILGHVVNENGIHPDPEKVEAILKFPSPKSIPDVRSFFVLCSYYRRFVENSSCKAKPLNDLLKNDAKFCWNKEQENAFEILKEALTSEPVLGHFIEDAETHIHTDASGYGIGAVLIQIQGGAERPIAYASRTLTKAEKNYSTTEKELLAVVWATSKFRPYLFGRNFTVVTDHHSLCWLAGLKDPSGRLARLNPVPEEQEDFPNIISIIDIRAEQSRDPNLAKIIDKIEQTGPFKGFEVVDGVLYKRNYEPYGRQRLLVLPKQMRLEILKNLHDAPTAGHLGFAKTYDRARKRFFWGGMYKTIRQYIAHCRECQRRKSVPQRPPGQLMPIPPADFPFQKIGMDLLGRFPVTNQGNKWIIVCTEYMTRFATTKAIPDAGAMEIAKFIVEEIILRHGAPQQIITDRGTNFMSQIIKQINNSSGINHLKTTAYHPQTNGLTERLNKTLTDMLSMYVDAEQKNWDEVLPFVTFAYNTAKQETTGFSPFFLVHGREAETTLDSLLPYHDNDDVGDYVQHLITTAEEARHLAQLHLYRGQEKDRKYYDRKHRPVDYKVGDLVWLFIPVRKVGLSEKLIKKYFGPYRITRKLSPVNYEIEAISDFPKRRKTRDTVHVLRMKPYLDPLLQEEISGSTPNKEPVLKQRFSDPEPISGPVTRLLVNNLQLNSGTLFLFKGGESAAFTIIYIDHRKKGSIDGAPVLQTAQHPITASRSDACPVGHMLLREYVK